MSLRELRYSMDYRSGHNDLIRDFFQPSLREATSYSRAVGYFSSSALEAFGTPLGEFVKRDGHIRLVTSVELSKEDLDAIESGAHREEVCQHRLSQIIASEFGDGVGDGVARLARLIELERLEIRIAVPDFGTGIYHEKIGIFADADDYVAFTGSSNESRTAFENNRECIDVYPSWSSHPRAVRKRRHFEELWQRKDRGVSVYTVSEAVRLELIKASQSGRTKHPQTPRINTKWSHQSEAVRVFLAAERGVLNMATGTGKTRTAITIIERLLAEQKIETVIVSVDGNDLLDQWHGELLNLLNRLDISLVILRQYGNHRQLMDFTVAPNHTILLSSREPVARALRELSTPQQQCTLLVHDEVHGIGSPGNRKRLQGLSDNIRFRLGLSATPERIYDREGTEFIEKHIGPVLVTFGLEEAIERGILAPFEYHVLPYEPTHNDRERVRAIFSRQSVLQATDQPMTDQELYTKVSHVYKTSHAKLPVFAKFIKNRQELLKRCIIFTQTQEYGKQVSEIVHEFRPDYHEYFTGQESATLERFARGDLECLVTCHRLSEGIDIRSLRTVILFASDRARLETIQRIGRCLRTDPNMPYKSANIVDFVRPSREDESATADDERCSWLTKLSRVRPNG